MRGKIKTRGISRKHFKGSFDVGRVCIEFGPIFLQFRFFNSKEYAHDANIYAMESSQNFVIKS